MHMTTVFCNHFDISKKYGKVISNSSFVNMGNQFLDSLAIS